MFLFVLFFLTAMEFIFYVAEITDLYASIALGRVTYKIILFQIKDNIKILMIVFNPTVSFVHTYILVHLR